jgi:RHS repeat-associated protein
LKEHTENAYSDSTFRFNGKEWDEETGNFYYGARYYDPKMSVWLSVDPLAHKYPSLSSYAFVANNPIMLVDPDGKEIWIRDGGHSYQYKHGQLFNKDGTSYSGKQKGFLAETVSALATINSTEEGGDMINELDNSTNEFYIVNQSNDNKFTAASGTLNKMKAYANQINTDPAKAHVKSGALLNGLDISGGSGGTVTWDPNGAILPTTAGGLSNATVNLAHEMFHALDANRGLLDDRRDVQGIKRSEWQAVYRENNLRSELGVPLRTHYGTTFNSNGVFLGGSSAKMLDSSGKQIKPSWYAH